MYSTCQLYVICQFKHDRKHAHWEEITSSFLPPMNGWPEKTNCKVLWKLVKIHLSSFRVIGTHSFPVYTRLHVHLNSVCVFIHALLLHTHPIIFCRLTGGKWHGFFTRHTHTEDFHFPRQNLLNSGTIMDTFKQIATSRIRTSALQSSSWVVF